MAGDPTILFKPTFDDAGVRNAYNKVQSQISRKPIKVNLAADARGLDDLNKGLGRLSGRADEFTKSLEASNARVLAFGASVSVIAALERSFTNLVRSTIEVEAALKKISVIGDQFRDIEKFGSGLFEVAKKTGQGFRVAADAATELARQGLGPVETLKRLEGALTLTRLSGIESADAVKGLTATMNAFRKEGLNVADVVDKLVALDNAFAVSVGDLIDGFGRSASVAQLTGLSLEEVAATITALEQVTARGGKNIGNSLKSIFERIQRVSSLKLLQGSGVNLNIFDDEGNVANSIVLMDRLAQKIKTLSKTEATNIAQKLFGTFQLNSASALLDVLESINGASTDYERALVEQQNASGAAARATNILNQSLDAQINRLSLVGKEFGASFGDIAVGPTLSKIVGAVSTIGESVTKNLQAEGPNLTKAFAAIFGDALIVGGTAAFVGIGLVIKKFAAFAKDSLSTLLGINSAQKNQEALQVSILNLLRSRGDIEQALLAAGNNQVAQAQVLLKLYQDMAAAEQKRLALSQATAKAAASTFVVGSTGLPTPRGKRAAGGFVPDLVTAEYNDVKRGVGGASPNSKVILLDNFPMGGGQKGPMVVNSSEGIVPMGNGGAAVLTRDMLDRMGYGKRAATGDLPSSSQKENEIRNALQKQRQEEAKKREKEAKDSQKAAEKAAIAAQKANEKAAKEAQRAAEKLAKTEKVESDRRIKEAEKAAREKEKAEKAAIAASIKAAEAEKKAAEARQKQFTKDFPVTAQLKRDQELKKQGLLLPPVSGGFGAFGKLNAEQIQQQARRQLIVGAGRQLSAGVFEQNFGFKKTFDSGRIPPPSFSGGFAEFGDIGFRKSFGGNPEFRRDIASQVPSVFSEFNRQQASDARAARGAQYRLDYQNKYGVKNEAAQALLKQRLLDTRQRGGIAGPGEGLRNIDRQFESLASSTEIVKKKFGEAASEFGVASGTIFLAASATKEILGAFGIEASKLTDTIRDVAIALVAFQKIGQIGGKDSLGGLLGNLRGGKIGRGIQIARAGGVPSLRDQEFLRTSALGRFGAGKVAPLLNGVSKLGGLFLRFLPVVGQFGAALFAANSVLKAFGIDAVESFRTAFGGLNKEGRAAQESIKQFSQSLFEGSKFIGVSLEQAANNIQEIILKARETERAEKLGVNATDKSPQELAAANFEKELRSAISDQAVGGLEEVTKILQGGAMAGQFGAPMAVKTGELRQRLFKDLSKSAQEVAFEQLQQIFSLTEDSLKTFVANQKIPIDANDGIEKIRLKVAQAVVSLLGDQIQAVANSPQGSEILGTSIMGLLRPGFAANQQRQAQGEETVNPQLAQQQVQQALELIRLRRSFNTEEERGLDLRLKTAQLNEVEKANLQTRLNDLALERSIRDQIFEAAAKSSEKIFSADAFAGSPLFRKEFTAFLNDLKSLENLSPDETLEKFKAVIESLGADGNIVVQQTTDELKIQLEGLKKITPELKRQQGIKNDLLRIESLINDQVRIRASSLESSASIRQSVVGLQNSFLEAESAQLNAFAGSPNASILQQEDARRKSLESEINVLRNNLREARNNLTDELIKNSLEPDDIKRTANEEVLRNNLAATEKQIQGQISALEIQKQQIGEVASAYTLLNNAILQFNRSLGELESSNILETLQAGDLQSLLSGLSRGQALSDLKRSGLSGQEGIQFLAERTSLRQKESEIALATTKAQELQLQQEINLLRDVFEIQRQGGSIEEKILKLREAQTARLKEQRSLATGVKEARAQIQDELALFSGEFGKTATLGFRDAISEALKAAANNTGDLKNALLDVALSFANKLRDAAIDNLANIIVNRTTGDGGAVSGALKFIGGLLGGNKVQAKASGGKVVGGSGAKDDVPTLLMGGEYVINKKSVQKYGPQFFEALNRGSIGGMANGGMFVPGMFDQGAIRGAGNLRRFASQQQTSGRNDQILDLGGGALIALEPESFRLSNFARQAENPINQAVRETKEQALGLFFEDQRLQAQYKEQLRAEKKAEKEKVKQLLISLALAGVTSGVGAAFSSGEGGGEGSLYGDEMLPTYDVNNDFMGMTPRNQPISSNAAISRRTVISSPSSASNVSPGVARAFSSSLPTGGGFDQINPLLPQLRNSGGVVRGKGYSDETSVLAMGGEGVLNRRAMKSFGVQNLNNLNMGGSIGVSEEKSEELNNRVISKLDELVEKLSQQGNITINVTSGDNNMNQSSDIGTANEERKNLARRVKDEVLRVIQEEKRAGGMLRS